MTPIIPQSMQNGVGSIKVVSGSGFRYLVPFPYKLHQMLEETEEKGYMYSGIVSWLPDGLHFKVHDATAFMEQVVPQYFKQKSFKSFQRQLHIYGFKRVIKGSLQGAFHHPKFIKGNRHLTHDIDRIKAPVPRKNAKPANKKNKPTAVDMGQSSVEPTNVQSRGPRATTTTTTTPSSPPDDTLEWFVNTGFQFSDLEPSKISQVPTEPKQTCITPADAVFSSDLLSQAGHISNLFSSSSLSFATNTNEKQQQQQQQQQQLFAPMKMMKSLNSPSTSFEPRRSLLPETWTLHTTSSMKTGGRGSGGNKKKNNSSSSPSLLLFEPPRVHSPSLTGIIPMDDNHTHEANFSNLFVGDVFSTFEAV